MSARQYFRRQLSEGRVNVNNLQDGILSTLASMDRDYGGYEIEYHVKGLDGETAISWLHTPAGERAMRQFAQAWAAGLS